MGIPSPSPPCPARQGGVGLGPPSVRVAPPSHPGGKWRFHYWCNPPDAPHSPDGGEWGGGLEVGNRWETLIRFGRRGPFSDRFLTSAPHPPGSGVVASFGIAPDRSRCPRVTTSVRSCHWGQGGLVAFRPSTPLSGSSPPFLPGRPVQGTRWVGVVSGWVGLPSGPRGLADGDQRPPWFVSPPEKRCVSLAPGRGKLVHLPRSGYHPRGTLSGAKLVAAC